MANSELSLLCPSCRKTNLIPPHYAGRKVRCVHCAHEFLARPAEPTPDVIHANGPVKPVHETRPPEPKDSYGWSIATALFLLLIFPAAAASYESPVVAVIAICACMLLAVVCYGFGMVSLFLRKILWRMDHDRC